MTVRLFEAIPGSVNTVWQYFWNMGTEKPMSEWKPGGSRIRQKAAKNTGNPALLAAASGAGAPATKTTVELKNLLNRQMYSRMLPFPEIRILAV